MKSLLKERSQPRKAVNHMRSSRRQLSALNDKFTKDPSSICSLHAARQRAGDKHNTDLTGKDNQTHPGSNTGDARKQRSISPNDIAHEQTEFRALPSNCRSDPTASLQSPSLVSMSERFEVQAADLYRRGRAFKAMNAEANVE